MFKENSKCTLENPNLCRIHGDKRQQSFEKKAKYNLENAQKRADRLKDSNNFENFMYASELLTNAEFEYYATLNGEKELRQKIEEADFPEKEILEEKLKQALSRRERMEKEDVDEATYVFPSDKLPEAQKRLEKANKKLARAGIEERFGIEKVEIFYNKISEFEEQEMVKIVLNHPPLKINDWEFVAAVDESDNGFVLRNMPGQELNGYRPEEFVCEHCGKKRHRASTYLLKNSEGEYKQVGSGCLQSFLGVKPDGLWLLSYDIEERSYIDDGVKPPTGSSYSGYFVPLDVTVAYALAVSNNGESYKSSTYASDYGGIATSDLVKQQLFKSPGTQPVDYTPYLAEAKKIIKETEFDGSNDYSTNMKTILSGERIKTNHIGYATSVVSAWRRQNAGPKKEIIKPVGFLGEKNEKVKDIKAKITKVVELEEYYGYNPSYSTLLIMQTPDNKEIKWKASGTKDLNEGDKITISTATIKDHGNYNGADQTIITRAKYVIDNDENSTTIENN